MSGSTRAGGHPFGGRDERPDEQSGEQSAGQSGGQPGERPVSGDEATIAPPGDQQRSGDTGSRAAEGPMDTSDADAPQVSATGRRSPTTG
jgi:hypothetical protein